MSTTWVTERPQSVEECDEERNLNRDNEGRRVGWDPRSGSAVPRDAHALAGSMWQRCPQASLHRDDAAIMRTQQPP